MTPPFLRWAAFAGLTGLAWFAIREFALFDQLAGLAEARHATGLKPLFGLLIVAAPLLLIALVLAERRNRRDASARLEAERRLGHLSRHDPLTGLGNRREMSRLIVEYISRSERLGGSLAIVLMDLDRFKPINDLRGHETGDRILREVADRLCAICLPGQVPVRLGGDEFAVILRENDRLDAATTLARRILAAMGPKFQVGGMELAVGTSIGIALWSPGLDEAQLFRRADQAMYRAKREGRGRMDFFDDDLGERLRQAAELEVELTKAIEAEDIVPYFQPIMDISERSLVGFEVLARWTHARLGPVSPDRFIALAEDTGQINPISWLVLRQACRAALAWPDHLSMSFNLSPRQFRDSELASTISSLLCETGFPPERLEIEITESAVIEDLDYARETIERLRWLGIRISLDDFGTGFSSLATLSRLPFDRLKIDRSFVTRLTQDTQKAKIVAGIISLAESLDLGVTAEGIETEDTYEMLADLNCDLGQGFLFEKPLADHEVVDVLRSGRLGGMKPHPAGSPGPFRLLAERRSGRRTSR